MGGKGPPPTPTKVLAAHGSWRAKLNKQEPQPKVSIPVPPVYFTESQLEIYNDFSRSIVSMGLLTEVDGQALIELTVAWDLFVQCTKIVNAEGLFEIVGLRAKPHSCLKIMDQQTPKIHKGFEYFGLTPSARSRITVGVPQKKQANGSAKEESGKGRFIKAG